MTLGAAVLLGCGSARGQAASQPPAERMPEVVISATRQRDEVITARVVTSMHEDPYLFSDHITVVTEGGIVHVRGVVTDVTDLYRALQLARRIAGSRRVRNELELITDVECHD